MLPNSIRSTQVFPRRYLCVTLVRKHSQTDSLEASWQVNLALLTVQIGNLEVLPTSPLFFHLLQQKLSFNTYCEVRNFSTFCILTSQWTYYCCPHLQIWIFRFLRGMENTQFHKVDMKKLTPETSLFYHTNCLCWSIVPLRVPLQNIYLSTFSAVLEIRAGRPLSAFISFDPCNIPIACLVPPRSPWAPHQYFHHSAQLLTDSFSSWLSSSLPIATFRELLFPVVALVSSSLGLGHILLSGISVFHYSQFKAHALNYSSTINHGPKGTNESLKMVHCMIPVIVKSYWIKAFQRQQYTAENRLWQLRKA